MRRACLFAAGILAFVCTFVIVPSFVAAQSPAKTKIQGWASSAELDANIDRETKHGGAASVALVARPNAKQRPKTLLQAFLADEYRGRRIRLSAYVRSQDVKEWAGMWMRIDTDRHSPSFDNMMDRPIKGTADWAKHEIVLDVPEDAEVITLGLLIVGEGRIWIDDLTFEVIGTDIGTTKNFDPNVPEMPAELRTRLKQNAERLRSEKLIRPVNLDFES
jgi:hypothetical protein